MLVYQRVIVHGKVWLTVHVQTIKLPVKNFTKVPLRNVLHPFNGIGSSIQTFLCTFRAGKPERKRCYVNADTIQNIQMRVMIHNSSVFSVATENASDQEQQIPKPSGNTEIIETDLIVKSFNHAPASDCNWLVATDCNWLQLIATATELKSRMAIKNIAMEFLTDRLSSIIKTNNT